MRAVIEMPSAQVEDSEAFKIPESPTLAEITYPIHALSVVRRTWMHPEKATAGKLAIMSAEITALQRELNHGGRRLSPAGMGNILQALCDLAGHYDIDLEAEVTKLHDGHLRKRNQHLTSEDHESNRASLTSKVTIMQNQMGVRNEE